jgi:hypothetical protein
MMQRLLDVKIEFTIFKMIQNCTKFDTSPLKLTRKSDAVNLDKRLDFQPKARIKQIQEETRSNLHLFLCKTKILAVIQHTETIKIPLSFTAFSLIFIVNNTQLK